MRPINIVYEGCYDHVDVVLVPDEIANSIESVVQEFFCWLTIPENNNRFMVPHERWGEVLMIGTKEFIWWLNYVRLPDGEKATILQQNTTFVDAYPTAEF